MPHKNLSASCSGAAVTKVINDRLTGQSWQRHSVDTLTFAVNSEHTFPPIHIVKTKARDLDPPEPQVDKTTSNGVVPSADTAFAVKAFE
jgi:hypothetical protein